VNGRYKLKCDLHATNGYWYYAEYGGIAVLNEASNYKLIVSRYTSGVNDALSVHGAMDFTTYDRDNDRWTSGNIDGHNNCAVWNGGGFWYNSCGKANVNTISGAGNGFKWYYNLQLTRMMLTC